MREFYADTSSEWGYKPSYDGTLVAWYAIEWTDIVVRVGRTGENAPFLTIPIDDVETFLWHSWENRLLVLSRGRLWKVDPENAERSQWVDVTPRGFGQWYIQFLPRSAGDRMLITSRDRNPAFYDLYTAREDGGGKALVARNNGSVLGWWTDSKSMPLLRLDRLEDGRSRLLLRGAAGEENWRRVVDVDEREDFAIPFALAPQSDEPLFALSNRGRDKIVLVKVDRETGAETVVIEDDQVDVSSVTTLSPYGAQADFVTFDDGYPRRHPLTERGKAFLDLVDEGHTPVDIKILGASPDGRFITVARSMHGRSWEYFLYDLDTESATKLGEFAFRRNKEVLTQTKPVSFRARDGLEIPAYLTLPRGTVGKNLPTIVEVHGGPAVRVRWEYDHDNQFLANRGYAVLSINFRGSTGYGKAFRSAGYREFGGAMQDDIVDGARWLVAQGIADPQNMAVMGASFGGYAAALAMTRDPGLFKAAIVENAVLDVAYQMRNNPFAWDLSPDEMKRYFGDPENENDLKMMHLRSPQANVQDIEGEILLTAGKRDRVVGFEQSEEFERALIAAGKDVRSVYFENEGHSYSRWQTRVKRAVLIEAFLAGKLGGRSGGFDYMEWAAEFFE